ncbi:MAG TPA: hypothetical protein VGF48_14935 [Thermoanaerobaculia bacterium]
MSFRSVIIILLFLAALPGGAAPQKVEREGVAVEFLSSEGVMEGKDVELRFDVRAADGTPLGNVRPAAWIDAREPNAATSACREKVQSFLAGSLRARPQVDLNTYYVVTLNVEPSIAVIDPLIGFGGSKLLTAVTLESPGVDWTLSRDERHLFVAMPHVNRVAVVDTESWRVKTNIDVAFRPTRVALHGEQLWVLSDAAVTVIETRSLTPSKNIPIGRGPHTIAFDDKHAFVSNGRDGTVSLIDASSFAKLADVRTGASVDGLAFSSLASTLFAIDTNGAISIIDPRQRKVVRRIEAKAGLNSIQFAPGGRWGFVTNAKENVVHVLDASNGTIVSTASDVGAQPDQIAFTDDFAYVRAAGSDHVKMIRLASLATDPEVNMAVFPAGQLPPSAARAESFAAAIIPAPEPKSVLVANPADRLVYYYSEGMAAPMGNFAAKGRTPKAVLVVDRSLKESAPSVFSIRTRVPAPGTYDVAFFLDSPRVVHCFELAVKADPNASRKLERIVKIEPLLDRTVHAGEEIELKFRLSDLNTKEPHRNAKDVRALAFLAPGTWQTRISATPDGEGNYRVNVKLPEPGIYYVFLESASLDLRLNKGRPLIFEALGREP